MKTVLYFFLSIFLIPTVLAETFSLEGQVVSINPVTVTRQVRTSSRDCWTERVPVSGQAEERSYGGAVIGAVVGGLLGNQVGKGSGNKWATGVGAATGAIVGDNVDNDGHRGGMTQTRTVRHCPEPETEERIIGYDVKIRIAGSQDLEVRMKEPPGITGDWIGLDFRGSVTPARIRRTIQQPVREW